MRPDCKWCGRQMVPSVNRKFWVCIQCDTPIMKRPQPRPQPKGIRRWIKKWRRRG